MIVAVGSTNPTKLDPVKEIFSQHFPEIEVIGITVSSGVSDQPMSDDEIFQGALTRAKTALKMVKDSEFGVGIESGLNKHSFGWLETSIAVIIDQNGIVGIGASGGLVVPDNFVKKIKLGQEMCEIMDELFATVGTGEGIGLHGIMTKGSVERSQSAMHAVAFALARHLHKDLYDESR